MKKASIFLILTCAFSWIGCTSEDSREKAVGVIEAPIPPRLSEESFAARDQAKEELVDHGETVEALKETKERSPLVIPEPARAVALLGEYREKVPEASGGALQLSHLAPERSEKSVGSLSLGNTSSGRLIEGRQLPAQGTFHRLLNKTIQRGTFYGTDELIDGLLVAAKEVGQALAGAPLVVGNLSQPDGGDIPQSVSHNSGRDADIAFYALSPKGQSVPLEWYVAFDADGYATDGSGYRLDAARNWAFVASLLQNRKIQIQYVFVADWIKVLLIDYAIRAGADAELIRRAEHVLMQPGDSSPHAEHFHLRLYCDLNDRLHGCHDGGKRHPWVEDWSEAVEERIGRLIDAYQSGVQSERDAALRELDLLRVIPEEEEESGEAL